MNLEEYTKRQAALDEWVAEHGADALKASFEGVLRSARYRARRSHRYDWRLVLDSELLRFIPRVPPRGLLYACTFDIYELGEFDDESSWMEVAFVLESDGALPTLSDVFGDSRQRLSSVECEFNALPDGLFDVTFGSDARVVVFLNDDGDVLIESV